MSKTHDGRAKIDLSFAFSIISIQCLQNKPTKMFPITKNTSNLQLYYQGLKYRSLFAERVGTKEK